MSCDAILDEMEFVVKEFPYQANQGPAAARNNGACEAKGDIILFTDSDCIPDHCWIQQMTRPFSDPDVVAVKDSYTPVIIKIQTMLMALSITLFPLALVYSSLIYPVLLSWGIIVVSAIPFSFKTFKKDRPVGLISPGVILPRSMVFALGSMSGAVRCLFQMPAELFTYKTKSNTNDARIRKDDR